MYKWQRYSNVSSTGTKGAQRVYCLYCRCSFNHLATVHSPYPSTFHIPSYSYQVGVPRNFLQWDTVSLRRDTVAWRSVLVSDSQPAQKPFHLLDIKLRKTLNYSFGIMYVDMKYGTPIWIYVLEMNNMNWQIRGRIYQEKWIGYKSSKILRTI